MARTTRICQRRSDADAIRLCELDIRSCVPRDGARTEQTPIYRPIGKSRLGAMDKPLHRKRDYRRRIVGNEPAGCARKPLETRFQIRLIEPVLTSFFKRIGA